MKIGIVDIDTSHPQNWIPIERELGHEIVGVFDGGAVHPRDYVHKFVEEHKLNRVYEKLEDLVNDCDCAIIHGCDWDTHVSKARPFIEAGKSVLVDKPMAGNLRDINQLLAWAKQGKRITGGSSLRFSPESTEWLAKPESERGTPFTCFTGCGVDEFNYGIHAYAVLQSFMGAGIESVQHIHQGKQRLVRVNFSGGRIGLLSVGTVDQWLPFHASIVTNRGVTQFIVDSARVYRALLTNVLPYLAGEADQPPVPMTQLVEIEKCALAARKSWLHGDRVVALTDLREDDGGYDGPAFAVGYRKARYPQ